VYQHFRGIGNKDVWGGYWDDHHPHAMFFAPRVGLSTSDKYRGHLDALDLASVVMAPYGECNSPIFFRFNFNCFVCILIGFQY